MIFKHFLTAANESNSFVIGCEETGEAILVDAGAFEPAIADFLRDRDLRLAKVFITHDHYDHTGGLAEVVRDYGAEVFAGRTNCGGCKAKQVRHGDEIRVGRLASKVLATPGHTLDALSLYFPGMVFTGDALFAGSVGGTSSSADAKQQIDHIRKNLFTLPDGTEIHPGHGPSSTVAIESRYSPFFT